MNVTEFPNQGMNRKNEVSTSNGPEAVLEVRYMLVDRREGRCPLIQLTADEAVIATPERPEIGSPIISYVQGFGRFEGTVSGFSSTGLHIAIQASDSQRQRMQERLAGADMRRAPRVQLSDNHSTLVLEGGVEIRCQVRDISLTGAALETDMRPAIGSNLLIGRTKGKVVRHFPGGIGIEFIAD